MPSPLKIEAFYEVFREIIDLVHSSTNVSEVLDLIVWKSTEVLEAKGSIVRILNLETGQLELGAAYGLSERYLAKGPISNARSIADLCRHEGVIIFNDILKDPRIQYPQEAWEEGIRMMLNFPITLRKNLIGVIRIFFGEMRKYSSEELDFLTSVARQCALALERARLFEEQQCRYDQLSTQTEKLSSLGRMAAGIAHEINNPLSGILLYGTNLRKKVGTEGPLKEGLDVIIHETIRCRGIIQDLLEFSREGKPERSATNMNCIIEKALSLLENVFALHHISLQKDLSPDMPECLLDPNQMQQVFINLALNAVEAIHADGTIAFRSYLDFGRNYILAEVEDTGCGISEEDMPRIFEPFFSTKPKGTGLGLAVSYGIVKSHHGNIKVFSRHGDGAKFVIQLPIVSKGAAIAESGGHSNATW